MNGAAGRFACAVVAVAALGCARDRPSDGQRAPAGLLGRAPAPDAAGGDGGAGRDATPPTAVCEGSGVTLPERGSAIRMAVVEVVRAHLATKLELKVDRIVVAGDWAYLEGAEQIENGRRVAALLRRQRGAWTAVEVLTAPPTDDALRLRARVRANPRKPPPPLFGAD